MFGWNLPSLFDKHYLKVAPLLPEEYHYRATLTLVAILTSRDNAALIDDPSARFHEESINSQSFRSFISSFVDELRNIVCNVDDPKIRFGPNSKSYMQGLYGEMTGVLCSKMNMRNPAIPAMRLGIERLVRRARGIQELVDHAVLRGRVESAINGGSANAQGLCNLGRPFTARLVDDCHAARTV